MQWAHAHQTTDVPTKLQLQQQQEEEEEEERRIVWTASDGGGARWKIVNKKWKSKWRPLNWNKN